MECYKILIITRMSAGGIDGGVAVHQVVVDFPNKAAADIAISAIAADMSRSTRNTSVIPLY
jgi:hypothetical protein